MLTFPSVESIYDMFVNLNEQCQKTGESVVPLTDTEYYTEQLSNIFIDQCPDDVDGEKTFDHMCMHIACMISDYSNKINKA